MRHTTLAPDEMINDGGATQELMAICARIEAWNARAVTLGYREFSLEYEQIAKPLLARMDLLREQLTVAVAVHEARKTQAKGLLQ